MYALRGARIALTVGAVAILLGGCQSASPIPPAPTTGAPSTGTPSVPAGPPTPVVIPETAFFRPPAATSGVGQQIPPGADAPRIAGLPSLCGARFASDASLAGRRARHFMYFAVGAGPDNIPDGTVDQTIMAYAPGGAAALMRELRSAVTACPTDQRDGAQLTNRLLTAPARGDEALLAEETWHAPPGTTWQPTKSLIAAIRVGDVVTVLVFIGWEGIDASPTVADTYTRLAVDAINTWRR